MSEEQVLPAWTHEERLAAAVKIDEIIESQQFAVETIGHHGYMPGMLDIQCELVTLRASLAQSEAERERLQAENIKLLNDASVWRNRAIGAEEEIREGGRGIDLRRGFER